MLRPVADDLLRALERDVAVEGAAPVTRLAYARALERVGRGDEALAALLPAIDDAAVRRRIATYSAWTHPGACAGRTRFVDVLPLEREPRVAWRLEAPFGSMVAAASELGIVLSLLNGRLLVVDARTGEVRRVHRRAPGTDGTPVILRDDTVLLGRGRALVARDIWTGKRRLELALDAEPWALCAAERRIFVGAGDQVLAFAEESLDAPVLAWKYDHEGDRPELLATAEELFLDHVVLDARTGAVRRHLVEPPARADVRGTTPVPMGELRSLALAPGGSIALWNATVPYRDEDEYRLSVLDRSSGTETRIRTGFFYGGLSVSVARDVIFAVSDFYDRTSDGLIALRGQDQLWSRSDEALLGRATGHRNSIQGVVPLPGRLLVLVSNTLVCLEAASEAPRP